MRFFAFITGLALTAALTTASGPSAAADPPARPSPIPIHGMPKIITVDIPADRDFYAGQTIHTSVVTSSNVGYVEARIRYRNAPMHHDGAGRFSLNYTIPWWLPPWLRHSYTLQVIARSIDGVEVKAYFPIRIH